MVKKKIFDIAPRQGKKSDEPKIVAAKSVKRADLEQPDKKNKIIPLSVGMVILAAAALSYFYIPHKAKIDIWPKKNSLEETADVLVGKTKKGDNFVQGEILQVEKTVSQAFTAQSKKIKSTKAQGIVRVYNNFSTSPQILVANTRFVSNDGKLFRVSEKITIPGGHYDGGKLVAGVIDAKIVADQPGEDYNIGASTFSIPGFVGTPKYTAFYAKSSDPMTGGEKREVTYVTQEDLDNAKNVLVKIAPDASDTAVRGLISSGKYILINGAISTAVADFKSSVAAGDEASDFSAQIKSTTKAVVFSNQGLIDFAKSYIGKKLLPEEKLIESSVKAEYSPESVSLEKNELVLKVAISAQSHSVPEESRMKDMIKSKNIQEIESILKGVSSIEKAKVEFWPFWVNLAPDDFDGIEVALHLD